MYCDHGCIFGELGGGGGAAQTDYLVASLLLSCLWKQSSILVAVPGLEIVTIPKLGSSYCLSRPYAITRLTAHFIYGLMSDLVICRFRKSMVIHDTKCPY